jgi:hypothetical protein
MVINDPIFTNYFNQSLPFQMHLNEWKVISDAQAKQTKDFLQRLIRLNHPDVLTGEFFGSPLSQWSGFQIRKHITFLGPDYPLDGDTVQEAVCYSKNESKHAKLNELIGQFNWDLTGLNEATAVHEVELDSDDYARLQAIRAMLTNKKLLILNRYFDSVSVPCEQELRAFLQRYKNKSILEFQQ